MKQYFFTIALFLVSLTTSLSQNSYYSVQSGNWNSPNSWTMDRAGKNPASTVPTPNDTVFISDSIYIQVNSGHIHRGNVYIDTTGVFEIFSGNGLTLPYIFAGDSFVVQGKLITSSDFQNQRGFVGGSLTTGSDGTGVLYWGQSARIDIGDDLILNSYSTTIMDNAGCGDGTTFDDIYFKGTQASLCGNGKFYVPDDIRAWDDNNKEVKESSNYIGWLNQLSQQICPGFDFYGTQYDCENEINVITFPVELISFTGQQIGPDVQLIWKTASESNNDFFTLERSSDGEIFDVVEFIPGAGNSNKELTYRVIDRQPGSEIVWYRLKQTDFDGNFSFSPIIQVNLQDSQIGMNLYPNPANSQPFTLELIGFDPNDLISVSILDISGKEVFQTKLTADHSGRILEKMNPDLSSGMYVVKASFLGRSFIQKFIY